MSERDDFPECWTAEAVIDELTRLLAPWNHFANNELRSISAQIMRDMQEAPMEFERHGIENSVDCRAVPFKNRLFLLLDLDDVHRFPFDVPGFRGGRRDGSLIWTLGLTEQDYEHWEREFILTSTKEISERETQIVLAILKLHQRLADIRIVGPMRHNPHHRGGGGGGGGGGALARMRSRLRQ